MSSRAPSQEENSREECSNRDASTNERGVNEEEDTLSDNGETDNQRAVESGMLEEGTTNETNDRPSTTPTDEEDSFVSATQGSIEEAEQETRDEEEKEEEGEQQEASASSEHEQENGNVNSTTSSSQQDIISKIHMFLAQHDEWQIRVELLRHELEDPQGRLPLFHAMMWCNPQNRVVLHSLENQAYNNKVGQLVGYHPQRDRFAVRIMSETKEVDVRAKNIRLIEAQDLERDKEESTSCMTKDKLLQVLFRPGQEYQGTIQIPGLQGAAPGRNEYSLVIDSAPIENEMGDSTGILARHCAYDDEQFVWIHVDDESDELSIRYADGETQCEGTWNVAKGQFEGTVRQLLPTEDSIYHARDEVTHTFTLSPTTSLYPKGISSILEQEVANDDDDDESNVDRNEHIRFKWEQDLMSPATKSLTGHCNKTNQMSYNLVDQFRQVSGSIDSWIQEQGFTNNREETQQLCQRLMIQVKWRDLLIADSLAAEKTCATLRRRADLLDSLSFSSVQERTNVLASLHEKGVTRALAHAESDERKQRARDILTSWGTLSALAQPPASVSRPGGAEMTRMLVMCSRLERNFARFDGALRRAEERLTDADIRQWVVSSDGGESGDDNAICTVCHGELEEDGRDDDAVVLRLPCLHSFHDECLREWLQHHSQCPVCRLELREES